MKKIIFILILALLGSCTFSTRQVDNFPSLPYEASAKSYAPVGKVSESLKYYVDFDLVSAFPHRTIYLMEDGEKTPIYVRYLFETTAYYDEFYKRGGNNNTIINSISTDEGGYDLNEVYALLLNNYLSRNTNVDVILNPSFTDSCQGDWYYAYFWIMVDRECTLEMTGTAARLK